MSFSIHARSGREKIFSSKIAHVLNDEETRKYIQSLKRLMTFTQTKVGCHTPMTARGCGADQLLVLLPQYPPEDVSMLMG
jgi:Prp18 domain